jgi:transcriptional regulator GlxA family with amidase domain
MEKRDGRPIDVAVVLLHGGYASTAVGPIEVFHSAGVLWNALHGRPPAPRFRVRTASVDGRRVNSACGLGLLPEYSIAEVKGPDIVVLAASGWPGEAPIAPAPALVPWLRRCHARGAYVAGICTGVAFLAESGILDGRQATTHWALAETARERYPKVRWLPEQFLTEDGRVFTSGGVYASIDLSLYLVEKFCGHEVAVQTAKSLLVSMPRSRQSGYSVLPLSRPHSDGAIREVEEHMQQHCAKVLSTELLAGRARMSPRTFIRRFKAATGRQPGAYLQGLRIAAAKEMLELGRMPIQNVCAKVGYEDTAFFRALFKRYTGMTPAEYRNRFGRISFERGELASGRPAA